MRMITQRRTFCEKLVDFPKAQLLDAMKDLNDLANHSDKKHSRIQIDEEVLEYVAHIF